MYYIASNYCLYFIVDIDHEKNVAIVYYMDKTKQHTKQKLSFEKFDPLWNSINVEDQEVLKDMFIPAQLSKQEFPFTKCYISEQSNFWSNRILLKCKNGEYISIDSCLCTFRMNKYERVKKFISTLGMNDSVFPWIVTNKQIYLTNYEPVTVSLQHIADPYQPGVEPKKVKCTILIEPPHTVDQWW